MDNLTMPPHTRHGAMFWMPPFHEKCLHDNFLRYPGVIFGMGCLMMRFTIDADADAGVHSWAVGDGDGEMDTVNVVLYVAKSVGRVDGRGSRSLLFLPS